MPQSGAQDDLIQLTDAYEVALVNPSIFLGGLCDSAHLDRLVLFETYRLIGVKTMDLKKKFVRIT